MAKLAVSRQSGWSSLYNAPLASIVNGMQMNKFMIFLAVKSSLQLEVNPAKNLDVQLLFLIDSLP